MKGLILISGVRRISRLQYRSISDADVRISNLTNQVASLEQHLKMKLNSIVSAQASSALANDQKIETSRVAIENKIAEITSAIAALQPAVRVRDLCPRFLFKPGR